MADPKKKVLGKGLSALIKSEAPAADASRPVSLPEHPQALPDGSRLLHLDPTEIKPNPKQPRMQFAEDALQELAESIRRDGVQEPVIVRPAAGGGYELVSGERRVRASVMADVPRIPAICREVSDRDMLRLGLIENIQREDLNAIETARGYQDLIDEFGWTQEELAAQVGKNRATVTNTLRLLNLPEPVQHMLADGALSMGHARALLAIAPASGQIAAARKIVAHGLSVRQAEKLAADAKPAAAKSRPAKDPNLAQIEDSLRRSLGTKVALKTTDGTRGKIEIEYYTLDDLERILAYFKAGR